MDICQVTYFEKTNNIQAKAVFQCGQNEKASSVHRQVQTATTPALWPPPFLRRSAVAMTHPQKSLMASKTTPSNLFLILFFYAFNPISEANGK